MSEPGGVYVFDTSAFIEPWIRDLPQDAFPGFWESIDQLIHDERLIAPDEVFSELKKKADGLFKWVKTRKLKLIVETDSHLQERVTDVLKRFPKLMQEGSGKNGADPWVIALAEIRGGTVVSLENPGAHKIPGVCRELEVPCLTVVEVIQQEGWKFINAERNSVRR